VKSRTISPTNRVTGKPSLWLAVHECAHAVAGFVLDELPPHPGPFLRSVSVKPEGDTLGLCSRPRRVVTEFIPRVASGHYPQELLSRSVTMAQYDIVEYLAGPMAEIHQRCGMYAPHFVKGEWIKAFITVSDDEPGTDFAQIQETLRWLAPPDPTATMSHLWKMTHALVIAEWSSLVAMAKLLRDRVEMDGYEFKDRWHEVRGSDKTRARALKRWELDDASLYAGALFQDRLAGDNEKAADP
jgi:hypothetical protein